ncbi:hypothetical protein [Pseudohoeflea coraliihabitans]|uniref:DUF3160 domain-containing protein n=1 Tax=Pseudohoeflea coraliihabitans TaxID=2860393 RepID=A0ABS6WJU4_9HYPH|nr:hypothetical protein [Pseudohoeflea sp. DP4N28-3]MBW3096216.1 hypothetical protein [Pseudohoeflea sp. DP4N28-3]
MSVLPLACLMLISCLLAPVAADAQHLASLRAEIPALAPEPDWSFSTHPVTPPPLPMPFEIALLNRLPFAEIIRLDIFTAALRTGFHAYERRFPNFAASGTAETRFRAYKRHLAARDNAVMSLSVGYGLRDALERAGTALGRSDLSYCGFFSRPPADAKERRFTTLLEELVSYARLGLTQAVIELYFQGEAQSAVRLNSDVRHALRTAMQRAGIYALDWDFQRRQPDPAAAPPAFPDAPVRDGSLDAALRTTAPCPLPLVRDARLGGWSFTLAPHPFFHEMTVAEAAATRMSENASFAEMLQTQFAIYHARYPEFAATASQSTRLAAWKEHIVGTENPVADGVILQLLFYDLLDALGHQDGEAVLFCGGPAEPPQTPAERRLVAGMDELLGYARRGSTRAMFYLPILGNRQPPLMLNADVAYFLRAVENRHGSPVGAARRPLPLQDENLAGLARQITPQRRCALDAAVARLDFEAVLRSSAPCPTRSP